MKKRGKILRHPGAGPAIVIIEGQQHRCLLAAVWKSEALPRPGMTVEVTFDAEARIISVCPATEAHLPEAPAHGVLAAARAVGTRLLRKIVPKNRP